MDHYVDIELRPDPEFSAHQLMSALYAKLHHALVALARTDIGVSFPRLEPSAPRLGTKMRVHGNQASLTHLISSDWLIGMRDHVTVEASTAVPAVVRYRTVSRVQAQSNPDRLRRRLMRRQGIDSHEARRRIPDDAAQFVRLPFVRLRSGSTDQNFRLFIAHGPLQDEPSTGRFSTYGLSQSATVPWF